MGIITFNGVSSDTLGLRVERFPGIVRSQKKIDVFSVPGRNRDIILDEFAAMDYIQSYEIYAGTGAKGSVNSAFDAIADWLLGSTGYCRLEDDYDSNHYRLAYFTGPIEVENILSRFGKCTIQFTCGPQRYLKSGETLVSLSGSDTINNPTPYTAHPIITVYGSGSGTLTCGGNTLTISTITNEMIVDCEDMRAYKGTTNLNGVISGDFPQLVAGNNTFSFTGGVTSVSVKPNTWRL